MPALAGPDAAAFIATTENMRAVLALVERAALSTVPVLLEGETGTGKELLACAIHHRGPRPQAPFLVQNCAASPRRSSRASSSATCAGPSPAPSVTAAGSSR